MDKETFAKLEQGVREARAILDGKLEPARVRIVDSENEFARARKKLQLTQPQMAAMLGTPVTTYRHWERGLRKAHPSAYILLRVAEREPKLVMEAAEKA